MLRIAGRFKPVLFNWFQVSVQMYNNITVAISEFVQLEIFITPYCSQN